MIRTDRFTVDVDTFAADRRNILERSDARFAGPVRTSLIRLGLPRWDENIISMALDIFDETARSEIDQWNPIIDDMRDEFKRELGAALAKTKAAPPEQFDVQVERMTKWLSTYSVNAGTEAATTSDTETHVGLEWVTMDDSHVRDTHREARGETVPSGQPFEVGGFELLYPGQPVGPPEIWINCRCVARPAMLEGFKVKTTEFTSEEQQTVDRLPEDSPDSPDSPGFTSVTAAVEPAPVVPAPMMPVEQKKEPVPWYGVLAPEGTPSGDGRQFDVNGLTHRDLPLPLKAMFVDDDGHKGSVIVGRIDNIFRDGGLVKGEGVFDDSALAAETVRMLAEGMWRGVSVDIDDMQATLSEDGSVSSASGRICAATICAIPAFAEAFVGLGRWADVRQTVDQLPGEDVSRETSFASEGSWDGSASRFSNEQWKKSCILHVCDGPEKSCHKLPIREPGGALSRAGVHAAAGRIGQAHGTPEQIAAAKSKLRGAYKELGETPPDSLTAAHTGEMMTLTAAVEAPVLPADWFKDPALPGPTPFTVTDDGRVYGHVATWEACHIGQPMTETECTTAPHSETNYAYFLTGEVQTDVGPVNVGQITMGGGHASDRMGVRAATSHYDSTSSAVADVTAGEDEYGIWVAGALRSSVSDEEIHALRAAAISGDWRRVAIGREGNLEMVAALAVNVPGFPIPRPSMLVASGGEAMSLVAASIPLAEGQDTGDSIEIPSTPAEKFNAARAKFRHLQVARAKTAFVVDEQVLTSVGGE
jgi:hypothetical protein